MRTMHMLVGNFFFAGLAHVQHLDGKAQGLACQRVVAVQQHGVAFDLHDIEHHRLPIIAMAFQLAAHLHAGRELLFRQTAQQTVVADTKGVFGLQLKGELVTGFLPFKRLFNFCQPIRASLWASGSEIMASMR